MKLTIYVGKRKVSEGKSLGYAYTKFQSLVKESKKDPYALDPVRVFRDGYLFREYDPQFEGEMEFFHTF